MRIFAAGLNGGLVAARPSLAPASKGGAAARILSQVAAAASSDWTGCGLPCTGGAPWAGLGLAPGTWTAGADAGVKAEATLGWTTLGAAERNDSDVGDETVGVGMVGATGRTGGVGVWGSVGDRGAGRKGGSGAAGRVGGDGTGRGGCAATGAGSAGGLASTTGGAAEVSKSASSFEIAACSAVSSRAMSLSGNGGFSDRNWLLSALRARS